MSLGPINCGSPINWWHLNVEGTVTTSNDASRWTLSQQIVGNRIHGFYAYAGSSWEFNVLNLLPVGPDGPSNYQNTAGTKQIFWIDGPGNRYVWKSINGINPITSEVFVLNFTDTATSLDYPSASCSVNWFARIEVDFAPALNTVGTYGGYGWLPLNF